MILVHQKLHVFITEKVRMLKLVDPCVYFNIEKYFYLISNLIM